MSVYLASQAADEGCWSRRGLHERILPDALERVRAGETHTLVALRLLDVLERGGDEHYSSRGVVRAAFQRTFRRVLEKAVIDVEQRDGLNLAAII